MTQPARIQRRPLTQTSSREAWRRRRELKPDGVPARILAYLEATGGACDFEVERALGLSHQQCSGDRRHLVQRGLVHASNRKRPAPSGVECIVWCAGEGPQVPSGLVLTGRPIREQMTFRGVAQ